MERVGSDVRRELERFGPIAGIAPIVEAWPAAVGPEIARNAWPARVGRDGTLHVHTSSSPWAFELAQLESRLRAALGELAPSRFRFAVGPLPEPAKETDEEARAAPIRPSPEHLAQADALARGIGDEDLRKVVKKAAAASLARAASDRSLW
jgi:hypothetical protein